MSHLAKVKTSQETSAAVTDEEGKLRFQRKEKIDRLKLQRKEALAKRASEVLRKIETAISRLDRQITASPSQDGLAKLRTNYQELEGKARALSQMLSNPHDHAEEHSIEDHHDEIHHDGSLEAHLHDYHARHHEVQMIGEDAKKLFQQEPNYRQRSHPRGTWASQTREAQESQR